MKILLIHSPITFHRLDVSPPCKMPLIGLGYVAAALRKVGHEIKILNCIPTSFSLSVIDHDFTRFGMTDKQILSEIRSFGPDIVGISCMFTSYARDAHNVARIVKEYKRDIFVIFGGTHSTTFYEEVIKDDNVDLVVRGEGEITACEAAERFKNKTGFDGVLGAVYRIDGKVKIEEPRQFIENLDNIPFPAWDLMTEDIAEFERENLKNKFLMRKPVGHIITSRGCPNECYFSSDKLICGRRWRARSAKNVVDEIEFLRNVYGFAEIHFDDDNCSVSKQRMHEICDEILKRKIKIKLATPTGIALAGLDREILVKMKSAGFYRLCFGIETGSQESQKIIKKRINLDKAKDVITIANKLGYWTSATFIFGFPHDTEKDIRYTIEFAKGTEMDFAIFYLLTPQPKTEVYNILKHQGLIDLDAFLDPHSREWYKISIAYSNGFRTSLFSNSQLQQLLANAYKEFLIHKLLSPFTYLNLVRKVNSLEDFAYLANLATIPFQMLIRSIIGFKLSNNNLRGRFIELKDIESVECRK